MSTLKKGDRVRDKGNLGLGTVLGKDEEAGEGYYTVRFDTFDSYDDSEGTDGHTRKSDDIELVESPRVSVFGPVAQKQLDEALGINREERLAFWDSVAKLATEGDATDPDYYTFGDVEVRQISGHLTGFGAQALQYIARATRLDGQNKGDAVEDLRKSIKFIQWEIERLEGE